MPTYKVTWEIEIDAENPLDACREAREIQQDPESIATIFEVNEKKYDLLSEVKTNE